MKRRQVLTWTAPVIAGVTLPVHAQTSFQDPGNGGGGNGGQNGGGNGGECPEVAEFSQQLITPTTTPPPEECPDD